MSNLGSKSVAISSAHHVSSRNIKCLSWKCNSIVYLNCYWKSSVAAPWHGCWRWEYHSANCSLQGVSLRSHKNGSGGNQYWLKYQLWWLFLVCFFLRIFYYYFIIIIFTHCLIYQQTWRKLRRNQIFICFRFWSVLFTSDIFPRVMLHNEIGLSWCVSWVSSFWICVWLLRKLRKEISKFLVGLLISLLFSF